MLSLGGITLAGVVVVAALTWFLLRMLRQDKLAIILNRRKAEARVISRADYVEGMERIPVALALTNDAIYYENPDLDASFELSRIDEVEYDNELATGRHPNAGESVLRLRAHGTMFEFLLPTADMPKWQGALPTRRIGTPVPAAATA